ncbi:MAG: hypothetical protein HUJ52_03450, partial [Malacoplasma sp.]|nr:hypothetical protein [Malacoplasma sp.]
VKKKILICSLSCLPLTGMFSLFATSCKSNEVGVPVKSVVKCSKQQLQVVCGDKGTYDDCNFSCTFYDNTGKEVDRNDAEYALALSKTVPEGLVYFNENYLQINGTKANYDFSDSFTITVKGKLKYQQLLDIGTITITVLAVSDTEIVDTKIDSDKQQMTVYAGADKGTNITNNFSCKFLTSNGREISKTYSAIWGVTLADPSLSSFVKIDKDTGVLHVNGKDVESAEVGSRTFDIVVNCTLTQPSDLPQPKSYFASLKVVYDSNIVKSAITEKSYKQHFAWLDDTVYSNQLHYSFYNKYNDLIQSSAKFSIEYLSEEIEGLSVTIDNNGMLKADTSGVNFENLESVSEYKVKISVVPNPTSGSLSQTGEITATFNLISKNINAFVNHSTGWAWKDADNFDIKMLTHDRPWINNLWDLEYIQLVSCSWSESWYGSGRIEYFLTGQFDGITQLEYLKKVDLRGLNSMEYYIAEHFLYNLKNLEYAYLGDMSVSKFGEYEYMYPTLFSTPDEKAATYINGIKIGGLNSAAIKQFLPNGVLKDSWGHYVYRKLM